MTFNEHTMEPSKQIKYSRIILANSNLTEVDGETSDASGDKASGVDEKKFQEHL